MLFQIIVRPSKVQNSENMSNSNVVIAWKIVLRDKTILFIQ